MNKQYKQNFLQAGSLAGKVRSFGKALIVKGASYNDVIAQIKQKIKELGAKPAFPPQIALNEVAAHFLPQPGKEIIFSNEIIKLDVGVCYEGAIGDCACTVDLSGKYQKLIDATEASLLAAEKIIQVGLPICQIGKTIEETIASYGFTSVKNLSGHGLGIYKIHTAPTIPNYYDHSKGMITPGMTFAIEPFATDGQGMIFEGTEPTIFSLIAVRSVHSSIAKALLSKIHTFNKLPFAIHDLLNEKMPLAEIEQGLKELLQAGIIIGYPPLIEVARGMVAQAENSILIDDQGEVFVTTRL
jgi:methionyl aminopeptidase